MTDKTTTEAPDKRTAQHGGEGGAARDGGRPAPGSGLDRRQERNGDATGQTQQDGTGGAGSGQTDPSNP